MSRKLIITIGTIACLVSTVLVVEPTFAARMSGSVAKAGKSFGAGKSIRKAGSSKAPKFSHHHKSKPNLGRALKNKPGNSFVQSRGHSHANSGGRINKGPGANPSRNMLASGNMRPGPGAYPSRNMLASGNLRPGPGANAPASDANRGDGMTQIVNDWTNRFKENLGGSYNIQSVGTVVSLCQTAAMCAAGGPTVAALQSLIQAPMNAPFSSTFEAIVNGFTPTDPTDPLSTPIDIGAKKFDLNPFNNADWPQSGPAAVNGQ